VAEEVAKEAAKVEETPKEVEVAVVEEELAKEVAQETLEDGLVPPEILAVEVVPKPSFQVKWIASKFQVLG